METSHNSSRPVWDLGYTGRQRTVSLISLQKCVFNLRIAPCFEHERKTVIQQTSLDFELWAGRLRRFVLPSMRRRFDNHFCTWRTSSPHSIASRRTSASLAYGLWRCSSYHAVIRATAAFVCGWRDRRRRSGARVTDETFSVDVEGPPVNVCCVVAVLTGQGWRPADGDDVWSTMEERKLVLRSSVSKFNSSSLSVMVPNRRDTICVSTSLLSSTLTCCIQTSRILHNTANSVIVFQT